jgi:hypothetical protein
MNRGREAKCPLHGAEHQAERFALLFCPHVVFGRTAPSNCRRAIHRLDSANSVSSCAVFFYKPLKRTFTKPNCRLITRNGCSTFARMLALLCSCFCNLVFARPSGNLAMSLGRAAICH